jgi:hypothetical protein
MFSGLLQAAKNSPFASPVQQAKCAPREQKSVNMAAAPSGINLMKFVSVSERFSLIQVVFMCNHCSWYTIGFEELFSFTFLALFGVIFCGELKCRSHMIL